MLNIRLIGTALACVFFTPLNLFSQEAAVSKAQAEVANTDDTVDHWIAKLNSAKARDRYEAMNRLAKLGKPAITKLTAASAQGNLDFRLRVVKIVQQLGMAEDHKTSMAAEDALLELAASDDERVAKMANGFAAELFLRKEEQATERFRKAGAEFDSENIQIGTKYYYPLQILRFGDQWKGDADLFSQIRYLRKFQAIELVGSKFNDKSLEQLPVHSHLVSIKLNETSITNEGVKSLARHKQLKRVMIYYANSVDQNCLEDLKKLKQLAELKLFGTGFAREELKNLQETFAGVTVEIRVGGFLGIRYQQTSKTCLITDVIPNSGAAVGGIKVGDTIVEYGGKKIDAPSDLSAVISDHKVGEAIKVVVLRGDKRVPLSVKLTKWQ